MQIEDELEKVEGSVRDKPKKWIHREKKKSLKRNGSVKQGKYIGLVRLRMNENF